jgi:hypothetical protein
MGEAKPMIFRSRKVRKGGVAVAERDAPTESAETLPDLLEQIDALSLRNREGREAELERRILRLRHRAGIRLIEDPPPPPEHPTPSFDLLPDGSALPRVSQDELTPEVLRAAILRNGCLLVRGLVAEEDSARLAEGIERAFAARDESAAGTSLDDGYYEEFTPDQPFEFVERPWVAESGGVAGADSPRLMFDMLEIFERAGLRDLITEYLGERPALSVQKCTLRKTEPASGGEWHQDGAFLGDVRALNVWLSLSHCGDVAPGLDIVPRRVDHVAPTGTDGALFDWSVSPAVAEELAGEAGIIRPIFERGDVLLFDELFLHRTAADPEMPHSRYAVESWFFGPSAYPGDYAPLSF